MNLTLSSWIILLALAAILYALGSGLYYLVFNKNKPEHLMWALTWRIILSFGLFVGLMLGFYFGWLSPHGIMPIKPQAPNIQPPTTNTQR